MSTTTKDAFDFAATNKSVENISFFQQLKNNYFAYADRQDNNRIIWYCKTLLVLPCGFMVPLVILMLHITVSMHTFYIGLLILLLFANVVTHVAQAKGRFFVPLYHITIAVMLFIPLVTYLFTL